MTRYNSLPMLIIILLFILSFFTFNTYSLEANIETAVKEEIFAGSEEIEILIYLQEQADTEKATLEVRQQMSEQYDHDTLKLASRAEVLKLLQEQARVKQGPILEELEEKSRTGEVKEYASFYVVNMIYARVEPQLIEKLARRPDVKHIYHNSKLVLDDLIEANYTEQQQTKTMPWNLHKIGAPQVWEKLGIDGTGVVIGFIDTGVAADHPALKNKWRGYDPVNPELDYNWFDPIYGRKYPDDAHGHGTRVTGIALGFDEESGEIVGVAPGASWIAVRGLNELGTSSKKNLLTAAQYMLAPTDAEGNNPNPEMAPDIVVNSWGAQWGHDEWFRDMVNNWRNAHILPVFAAGNSGSEEGSIYNPANYPESIAVGAIDQKDQLASFSSRGPGAYGTMIKPDLVAPGVKIYSTTIEHYGSASGTSLSAPHVAGVVALMLSGNPELLVEDLEKVLKETASPLTDSSYPDTPNYGYGYGMVDAVEAVAQVLETFVTLTISPAGESDAGEDIVFRATADGVADPEYQFGYRRAGGSWSKITPGSSDTYTRSVPAGFSGGEFVLGARVRETGTTQWLTVDKVSHTINAVEPSVTLKITPAGQSELGDAVTLEASSEGVTNPEYRFARRYAGGSWGKSSWREAASREYTPGQLGAIDFGVQVREAGGSWLAVDKVAHEVVEEYEASIY